MEKSNDFITLIKEYPTSEPKGTVFYKDNFNYTSESGVTICFFDVMEEYFKHSDPVLFTTKDGCDIRKGDSFYIVHTGHRTGCDNDIWLGCSTNTYKYEAIKPNHILFKCRYAAEKFINKINPKYSLREIKHHIKHGTFDKLLNNEYE